MTEWKELDINNLPGDLYRLGYEFISCNAKVEDWTSPWFAETKKEITTMLEGLESGNYKYRYRLRQPEPPKYEKATITGVEIHTPYPGSTVGYGIISVKASFEMAAYLCNSMMGREVVITIPPEVE